MNIEARPNGHHCESDVLPDRSGAGSTLAGSRGPLIGRHDELAVAAAAIKTPGQAGLVIFGSAGVGKSRLAQECGVLGEAAGLAVVAVLATQAASAIPLAALAPLLPAGVGPLGEGVDAVRSAAAAILAKAAEGPLMVVVDDAHLLDHVSATVVGQVAGQTSVLVVATVRSGEVVPDPVTALWKDGHAIRVDLASLGRDDVGRVAENMLCGRLHPTLSRALWRFSAGNPLFLRELVQAAKDAGCLRNVDGRWHLEGRLPTSTRLIDLIENRLGRLEPEERSVLELVAFGEPIDANIIRTATTAAALEAMEQRGLVIQDAETDHSAVRLGHPLYGEVLRAQTPPSRVLRIHAALADAVEARAHGSRDVLRVASWRLSDPTGYQPDLFVEAAVEARAAGDLELAAKLGDAARRAGGGAFATGLVAGVTAEAGNPQAAEEMFATASIEAVTDAERATVAMGRATNLFAGLGLPELALAVDSEALRQITDPAWRAEIVAHRATFELLLGRPVLALDAVAGLLDRREGRPFVQAAIVAVPALVMTGRSVRAESLAGSAYTVHSAMGHQAELSHAAIHVVGQIFALREAGRIAEALALSEFAYQAAVEIGSTLGQAYFGVQLGGAQLAAGRVTDAAASFEASADLMRELALPGRLRWSLAGAALAYSLAGDLARSDRLLAELDSVASPERLLEGEVERARAWNAATHGATSRARKILASAAASADADGSAGVALSLFHDLARLGQVDDLDRVDTLTARVEGTLALVRRDHVSAVTNRDGAALDAAATGFERQGAYLLAADAFAQAAVAHRRRAAERGASASRRHAQELARRCQGARTPALDALGAGGALTEREREIAALAVDGLGNPAIARQLFLSLRTVENHLNHVYTKLGITGRHELAAALDADRTAA
jgi:DNA-binding NarL/FixJ family response regulator